MGCIWRSLRIGTVFVQRREVIGLQMLLRIMQTLSWDRATQKCAVGSSWGRRDEAGGLDRGQNKSCTLTISKLSNQKKRQKKTKQIQINIINTSHYFCDFKMWEFCASVGFWFSLCRVLDYVSSCIILSCVGVIIVDRCCL